MPNLANIDELKSLLQSHGLWAKKSLGQHFLTDTDVLDQIIHAADLHSSDVVLEIGAGPGVLSQRLAPHVRELHALELDSEMKPVWSEVMKNFSHATLHLVDALSYSPSFDSYKIVANVPYYITSPLLRHFLRDLSGKRPSLVLFLIQSEVAERICDLKKPTLLSWLVRVFGTADLVCRVPGSSFYPPPKVESALLRIRVFDEPLIPAADLDSFFSLLEHSYRQPRKTLLNNLSSAHILQKDQLERLFAQLSFSSTLRPHQLSLSDWKELYRLVNAASSINS